MTHGPPEYRDLRLLRFETNSPHEMIEWLQVRLLEAQDQIEQWRQYSHDLVHQNALVSTALNNQINTNSRLQHRV